MTTDVLGRRLAALGAGGLGVLLIFAWLGVDQRAPGLEQVVSDRLADSGVSNPVTAVLLNFRAIDTLLEIAVLLLTLIGVWALRLTDVGLERLAPSPVFDSLLRFTTPTVLLIGAYLLWIGAKAPGGAFQAGAVLAGAAILLRVSGRFVPSVRALTIAATFGLLVFVAAGAAALAISGALLDYPEAQAGTWILIVETAATVSIAAILTALFIGTEPAGGKSGK